MFTARDLLYKAMDYDGFWNTSKKMLNSKPSTLRKLQLEKLLIGFDISKVNAKPQTQTKGNLRIEQIYFTSRNSKQMNRTEYLKTLTNFRYFTRGEFISDRSPKMYQDLIAQIISTSKRVYPEQSEFIDKEPVNLVQLFRDLYSFRHSVYAMNKYNYSRKSLKLFSTEDDYAQYLRNNHISSTETGLAETDKILCTLIDPENKTVTEDEISYPEDNLKTLDEEWENERQNHLEKGK
jgi:hypothetical protein